MGNVTITMSAEWAVKAVEDLLALRDHDPVMEHYTPALSVVLRRLADALPTPEAAPGTTIVTRSEDLVTTARYSLWVCNADLLRPGVRHTVCNGHSIHVTGIGAEIRGVMTLYPHSWAERLA